MSDCRYCTHRYTVEEKGHINNYCDFMGYIPFLDSSCSKWKGADRTGHWVSKDGVYGVAYCSECDYELHSNDTNFCPNCGADMRGEQDGNR